MGEANIQDDWGRWDGGERKGKLKGSRPMCVGSKPPQWTYYGIMYHKHIQIRILKNDFNNKKLRQTLKKWLTGACGKSWRDKINQSVGCIFLLTGQRILHSFLTPTKLSLVASKQENKKSS